MSRFLNDKYKKVVPYTPGEQPKEKEYIKLNTNESPFPPAISLKYEAYSGVVSDMRLYSDPEADRLKRELARFYKVKKEEVFVGNGSDECLYYSFMAFGGNGVSFPDLTYGFYKVYADINGVRSNIIPLKEDFTVDVNDYKNLESAVVIANPNAPTGLLLGKNDIRQILETNRNQLVIVDEAYIDFAPFGSSAIDLIGEYDNLLVVQTFSKSRSLAGARVGYAIGNRDLIADLEKLKFSVNPYNVSAFSMEAAIEAVRNVDYFRENCQKIKDNREYTRKELVRLGFEVVESDANFLLVRSDRLGGREFYERLRENRILVRHFESERIREYNRVSIGSMEEMKVFVEVTKGIVTTSTFLYTSGLE